jgi:hypothetical protein
MNETVENEEFDLTGLYEEDAAAKSASDTLMSHTGSDQDNAIASAFQSFNLSWCIQDSDFLSFI